MKKKHNITKYIVVAMILGIAVGYACHSAFPDPAMAKEVAGYVSLLSDVFLRVGGDLAGQTETALTVNSDNVLLDDIWAWRADHGLPGTVGWTVNTADQGVIVNGDNVTATGLFVEHFQKYDVTWNGNGGEVVFFQNEMPYDAPNQAAWQHDGVNGYVHT